MAQPTWCNELICSQGTSGRIFTPWVHQWEIIIVKFTALLFKCRGTSFSDFFTWESLGINLSGLALSGEKDIAFVFFQGWIFWQKNFQLNFSSLLKQKHNRCKSSITYFQWREALEIFNLLHKIVQNRFWNDKYL